MRKTKRNLNIVAITTEGVNVVDGIFRIFDSEGLPLDEVFSQCVSHNLMPSWIHFYDDAKKQGWSHETIVNRLEIGIRDIYGKDFSDAVIYRLELYEKTL